jgi:RHS repeat-associated protein
MARRQHRLDVEPLELRQLLSTVNWINPGGGSWDVGSNWSTGTVPGPNDDVVINVNGASPTVTIGSNVEAIQSIAAADPLSISGGGLTVTADSTISGGLTMTGGSLTATGSGVSLAVTGTTTDSGGSLNAENGASLSLPDLASYAGNTLTTTLEATGAGSTLTLAHFKTVTEGFSSYPAFTEFEALDGGAVTLPALQSIDTGTVTLEADGTGSVLSVPALTSVTETGGYSYSTFQASNGGTVNAGALSSLSAVNLNSIGTGESFALPGLTSLTNSVIAVSGGATLTLPPATAFTAPNSTVTVSGIGSSLAIGTGVLNWVPSSGTGVVITIPALPQGLTLDLDPTGTFSSGTTINVGATATVDIDSGTYTAGTTLNVDAGATVTIEGGTYTGGVAFNVGQGAVVDLTGGNTVTYGGTLTGSGAGTVQLSGGTFYPAAGSGGGPGGAGVTLNFPGSMFQWTGGAMELSVGDVTNEGTINLSGSNQTQIYADGTLYDEGTIIQTGAGDFGLHSDNITPTTLWIEPGGSYVLESDAGINDLYNTNAIVNEGTIQKTDGTGTSTISVTGQLTNTGTIEADSGTLDLEPTSFAQLSSGSLTGGTWNALDGATLKFPSGTTITGNAATVALGGGGATVAALSGLASNSGSLRITGGATLTTSGGFSNSGDLTVGAGSTLKVGGNFTLAAAGTLAVQLGGTPESGQYGQVTATGSAALAGNLSVSLVNGFSPSLGQDYPVISFASGTVNFGAITGLPSGMTATQTATALDLDTGAAGANLAVTSVTAPTTAAIGQSIAVGWQVKDVDATAAAGSWQDSVYLSPTSTITGGSILLGTAVHTGGLGASATYSGSLTAAVPALPPGSYYVIVDADSLYQVSDPDRTNNTLAATGQLAVTLPSLALDKPAAGSFTAAGQEDYYQMTVPAGGSLVVSATSAATSGALAVYVSQGTLPTPYGYQDASAVPNQPSQTAVVPQVLAAGTYDILVESVSGAAATSGYTLTITQGNAPTISGLSTTSGGNAGNLTVGIAGTNFAPTATPALTLGASTIPAAAIDYVNASQIYATFDLKGATVGSYTLGIHQGGQVVTATSPIQVVAATAGKLSISLSIPKLVRVGRTATIVVNYANTSDNDIVAPLLAISSTDAHASFSTPDDPNGYVTSAEVLAVAPSGPAGIIRPGQSGQLTLTLLALGSRHEKIPIEVAEIEAGQTIDWLSEESALRPSSIPTAGWDAIWSNLMAMVGTTTDSYDAALAQAATYLGGVGETTAQVSDVSRLWAFLTAQADAAFPASTLTSATDAALPAPGSLTLAIGRSFDATIDGRDQPGPFGLGWTMSWQISLSTDASGNVTIDSAGSFGDFVKQPNGSFLDTNGTFGALNQSGGTYTFTATSGTQLAFLPDGQLNYEQDTNGNRITLGYDAQGQLTSLTYANPSEPSQPTESLTLAYNPQGFVSTVTDGLGDTWSYNYDSAGHLLSVTAPGNLTTSYTYETGSDPETAGALLSVTHPDGSQQVFAYDAQGRLSETSASGGADPISYTYDGEAEITTSDAAGDTATVWYNAMGLAARVQDPLGGLSNYTYNNNGDLVGYTDAVGNTYQYSYDSSGNVTQTVNPLGQAVSMTYGPLGNMTSITNADNNTTQYNYDAAGNLLDITYPDGTQQSFQYDPLGNMTETVEQNGDAVGYHYNSQGLVTDESFADKTSETFTYDVQGNMLAANTFNAAGTLTGTTTLTYNTDAQGQDIGSELASITYPDGQYLKFTYDTAGQRTASEDQSGFTVNYHYDTLGRLSELTDGSNNLIAKYMYNDVGELETKLNGNGTSTSYHYDAAGDLTSEVNYAPDGKTVNSSFSYRYNVLGEVTTMTDAAGNTTSYGYDPTGQLTQVNLPGGQTITYVYNAAGDRTKVIDGSTATSYQSNSDNEITQIGSTIYAYDANGNLHTVTDSSGTTTYDYNDLNQLVSITAPDGTVTRFQYSPLGFLVGEDVGGTQTNDLVDPTGGGNVVASYNGSGSLIADYVYGLGLVSQTGPSGTGYYDFDGSGNTVGITGASGSYVNQYSILPFGGAATISAALPNPFTFAGQGGALEIGTNLFDMRTRDYTPATGQFLSNDPIGLSGGQTNIRQYSGNNPVSLIDASGLDAQPSYYYGASPGSAPPSYYGAFPGDGLSYYYGAFPGTLGDLCCSKSYLLPFDNGGNLTVFGSLTPYDELIPFDGQLAPYGGLLPSDGLGAYRSITAATVPHLGVEALRRCGPSLGPAYSLEIPHIPVASLAGSGGAAGSATSTSSHDPNNLIGPAGYGPQGFFLPIGALTYYIDFENDGGVAAQDVTVDEPLSPNLDWSTFQLGSFGFGPIDVTVPAGLTQYQATLPYRNVDGTSLNVQVDLDFNVQTGVLTATFTSLDPLTGQAPTGATDGFLPPDDSAGIGEGFVQYTIRPTSGLATGTTINQQASVVFDINAPLDTAKVVNTIDTTVPTSSVAPLPATESSSSFPVSWSGSDGAGSGIASYDVYISDDGGPYQLWQSDTAATSATYAGQVGHTYRFYSVATSHVGIVQPTPPSPQATTKIVEAAIPPPPIVTSVEWTTVHVKAGSGKKAKTKSEAALQITFSEPVSGAARLGAYELFTVTTKKLKKKPVITLKPVTLTSARPASSPATRSVTLLPAGKIRGGQTHEIEIIGADISNAQGRALDGKDNGQAGTNFVAEFGPGGLTFSRPGASAASARLSPSAVDAVLPSLTVRHKAR